MALRPFSVIALPALLVVVLAGAASAALSERAPASLGTGGGWYGDERSLSRSMVSSGPERLFSTGVQGQVLARPQLAGDTLLVATEDNWIYGLDAATGATRWSRAVDVPWQSADVGCPDLAPNVGITGSPVIDTTTNTAYFVAKSYNNDGETVWKAHAVDVTTGAERSNFPVDIQGHAQNQPDVSFTPSQQMQRPGLLLLDGVVYAAFGGFCDQNPYYGWIAGISTAGELRALWLDTAGDTGGGIWQSGRALVSDGPNQILMVSGNGPPPNPGPGNQPPADLGQSAVRLQVQPDGTLQPTDFFSPANADELNATDADLGSSGVVLLPPQFFGTATHPDLAVTGGKEGFLYLLDLHNLGGRAQAPDGGDAVLSRVGPRASLYGDVAVWPGDGGYLYAATIDGSLDVYKYSVAPNGLPTIALAANIDGIGSTMSSPVVTSDGNTSGSALIWIVTPSTGASAGSELRAYDAVPIDGSLHLRYSIPVPGVTKFERPTVANGRIYIGTTDGQVLAFDLTKLAEIEASKTSVDLGTQLANARTNATVILNNAGTANAQITRITAPSTPFTLTGPTLIGRQIPPGSTLTAHISFDSHTPGQFRSRLIVDTATETVTIHLHATVR